MQALREVERERKREQLVASGGPRTDIQYLKNVILKLYETGAPQPVTLCPRCRWWP